MGEHRPTATEISYPIFTAPRVWMRRARTVEKGWPITVPGAVATHTAPEKTLSMARVVATALGTIEFSTTSEFSLKRRPLQL
jgi:hypothetical protein